MIRVVASRRPATRFVTQTFQEQATGSAILCDVCLELSLLHGTGLLAIDVQPVSGTATVLVAPGKKVDHLGIKAELIGQIGGWYGDPKMRCGQGWG